MLTVTAIQGPHALAAALIALAAVMACVAYDANLPFGAAAFGNAGAAIWAMLVVAPGVVLTAAGMFARHTWPQSRIGLLVVAEGLTYNIGMLAFTSTYIPVANEVSALVAWIPFAICAHVLLSYPSGRLARCRDRILVGAVYLWVMPGVVLTYLFHAPGGAGCPACPANGFLLRPDQGLDYATNVGWAAGMTGLLLVVAAVAHREHRRATTLARSARARAHDALGCPHGERRLPRARDRSVPLAHCMAESRVRARESRAAVRPSRDRARTDA